MKATVVAMIPKSIMLSSKRNPIDRTVNTVRVNKTSLQDVFLETPIITILIRSFLDYQ